MHTSRAAAGMLLALCCLQNATARPGNSQGRPPPVITGSQVVTSTVNGVEDTLSVAYDFYAARSPTCRSPLLMLGGLPTETRRNWREIALALSVDRDVYVIDPRGTGDSTRGTAPITAIQLALDTMRFYYTRHPLSTNPKAPVLVGCSERGKIALQSSFMYPQYLDGAVVCGTAATDLLNVRGPAYDSYAAYTRSGVERGDKRAWDALVYGDDWRQRYRHLHQEAAAWNRLPAGTADNGGELATALLQIEQQWLVQVEDPTLVLHGARDDVYDPQTAVKSAAEIGDLATLAVIDGPHAFWSTNTSAFVNAIRNWRPAGSCGP